MSLNLNSKTSYYQFDEFGMCVVPSDQSWSRRSLWKKIWDWILKRMWIPTWSNKSWKDSIGRTVLCWIAYGKPEELKEAINNCTVFGDPWNLLRHPNHPEEFASRDHFSYWVILQKLTDSDYGFNATIDCLPSMRGMNLWMKSLTGNKRAEFFYYFWAIPGAYIGNAWLWFCRWAGMILSESDNSEWINDPLPIYRTSRQKLWGWIILNTISAFALHIKAWQIYVMPDSEKKKKLQRILLRRVAKRNLLVRLLLGDDTVTQEEVDNFPHITNFPSGVYKDETCRRDIREMDAVESEFNCYEKDLIIWLYGTE